MGKRVNCADPQRLLKKCGYRTNPTAVRHLVLVSINRVNECINLADTTGLLKSIVAQP